MDIIHHIVGHNLPYRWQLIHEIQLNPNFFFRKDSLIIDDYKSSNLINKILNYIDCKFEKELLLSLLNDYENCEHVLDLAIQKLKSVFDDLVDEDYSEYFDSKLLYQMLKNNVYDKKHLIDLINFICDKSMENSNSEHSHLNFWKEMLIFQANKSIKSKSSLIVNFVKILSKLITVLKEQRVLNINTTLPFLRKFLKGYKGIEIERREMYKALKSGELKIEKTVEWLYKAKNNITFKNTNSFNNVITTYKKAIKNLFTKFCSFETTNIDNKDLPEFMVLDNKRISEIIKFTNILSSKISIWFIINKLIDKNLLEVAYKQILTVFNHNSSHKEIVEIVNTHKTNKSINIENAIDLCFKYQKNGIKSLMIERILDFIINQEDKPHNSLLKIEDDIKTLKDKSLKLINHYEQIYINFFHAILYN